MALNSLLDIPSELIGYILLCVSAHDVISCQCTCRTLCNLICSDSALRYLVQLERFGVTDDIRPGLSYPERLNLLEKREEAWAMLDFCRSVQITVPFHSTGIYDFTGGAFLLGTRFGVNRRPTAGYSYIPLPSLSDPQDQKLNWIKLGLGVEILDVGLAVQEHDLIAALTVKREMVKEHPADRHLTLEIRLFSFATGQPHPLAEQPIIFIARKMLPISQCNVLIEIIGEFLVFLITFPWTRFENEDMFFLVRWKKGEAYCLQYSEWGPHAYFSFLSQDILVIPNLILNTLEVVKIVIDESDDIPRLIPLCQLGFPPLTRGASMVRLCCRGEPNPTGSGPLAIPAPSHRPFRDKATNAIILFNVVIECAHVPTRDFDFPETRPFTFIVHRCALLAHIPAALRACAPFRTTSESVPAPVEVPWSAWGVAATRWFESDPASMRWITTTAGQRAVAMEDAALTPIIVRDFNPYTVRTARACAVARGQSQQCNWSEPLPNGNRTILTVEETVLPAGSVFKEDVRSALPYVEIVTQEKYRYQGVLIDEERILGLKTSRNDELGPSSFDVHILG